MNEYTLTALSPLDGRYAQTCSILRPLLSEFALFKFRLEVEVKWLIHLSAQQRIKEMHAISPQGVAFLNQLLEDFDFKEALQIKTIENTTRHDVKAVEYYLKEKLNAHSELAPLKEFVHFACTSEDINNLSYALMLKQTRTQIVGPDLNELLTMLTALATQYASQAMLSRTHGQAASPTTVGKEIANVVARLQQQLNVFNAVAISGKINGAVGNFNAHTAAYPEVDWIIISKTFVESLGLSWQPLTTQIEPHDTLAELMHALCRINTILIDFCRDMWGYISLGYFTQKLVEHEVGSSTMPHKINPIDFENAEGNLGIANALAQHLAEKLPISRWQRDLTDSTVLRNLATVFGHAHLSYQAILKGLGKLALDPVRLDLDLNNNWEVLGEAIQTVMRRYEIDGAYEKLKVLTRGKKLDKETLHAFIDAQALPAAVKVQLKTLTPQTYTGYAQQLTLEYLKHAKE